MKPDRCCCSRVKYTEDALGEEAKAIHGVDLSGITGPELYRALNGLNSTALCLSGGGIRSAAFALGIIQALVAHPRTPDHNIRENFSSSLLTKFHYLSTVSGGGYIGSWLVTWLSRYGFNTVAQGLRWPHPGPESSVLGWLRSYSNYLTPKLGVLSADSWSLVALYISNLMLNWLIILPIFCVVILSVKIAVVGLDLFHLISPLIFLRFFGHTPCLIAWQVYFLAGGVGVCCLLVALAFATKNRPSRQEEHELSTGPWGANQRKFIWSHLFWSVAAAVILTECLSSDQIGKMFIQYDVATCCNSDVKSFLVYHRTYGSVYGRSMVPLLSQVEFNTEGEIKGTTYCCNVEVNHLLVPVFSPIQLICGGAVIGALIYGIGWGLAFLRNRDIKDLFLWSVSGLVHGGLIALGFYAYLRIPAGGGQQRFIDSTGMPLTFMTAWFLLAQVVAQTMFMGITSYQAKSDGDREWLGRATGWLLAITIGWFLVMFLTFAGLLASVASGFASELGNFLQTSLPLVGLLSGITTAIIGRSGISSAEYRSKNVLSRIAYFILPLFALLFIAGVFFTLSIILDRVLLGDQVYVFDRYSSLKDAADLLNGPGEPQAALENNLVDDLDKALKPLVIGLVISLGIGVFASRCININSISLHGLYRNRLVRAFLGASRAARTPNSFTGFDEMDNPHMHELWPPKAGSGWWPFHVINMTLNVVSGKRLAWQERKAEPFTVTPLHCGTGSRFASALASTSDSTENQLGSYRSSKRYGGREGITVGTAMAISGAAASPNMGYYSSPIVTFLMTMFNVRLGWWLGNPGDEGKKTYTLSGPATAIKPLVQEAFGLTTDDQEYVYLSDGGHFDNLGLYEMIRRRCRIIVISDASRDPEFSLEELGNAVRKIGIDFGIPIKFTNLEAIQERKIGDSNVAMKPEYHAIGEIHYRGADNHPKVQNGYILYVKPAYHGSESVGVRSYKNIYKDFPHESTANQWFGESQFESYRLLGFEIMDGILNRALDDETYARDGSLESLLRALLRGCAPVASSSGVDA